MPSKEVDKSKAEKIIASKIAPYSYLPDSNLISQSSYEFSGELWESLQTNGKVALEREAIRAHFNQRGSEYTNEILRLSKNIEPMSPNTKICVVIPSYNEQDNLSELLAQINKQSEAMSPDLWEVIIVVNAPISDNSHDLEQIVLNFEESLKIIEDNRKINPRVHIGVLPKFLEKEQAGVGMARTLGHDVALMRSSLRDEQKYPLYIQTLDADTPFLPDDLFKKITDSLEDDEYETNILRLRGNYSTEVKEEYQLLNLLTILWEDSFTLMSQKTSNPWTIGRGMVLQAYAHACASAVKGNENGGAGEDVRIGTSMCNIGANNVRDFDGVSYHINPRREVLVLEGLQHALKENPGIFTRDVHEYARTLKAYLDFEDPRIRGFGDNLAMNELDKDDCENSLDDNTIEIMINSWWYLIRTEYSLDNLRLCIEPVESLYRKYEMGLMSYPILQQEFNKLERELFLSDTEMQITDQIVESNNQAALDLQCQLEKYGLQLQIADFDHTPPSMKPNSIFPKPLKLIDSQHFRTDIINQEVDVDSNHD